MINLKHLKGLAVACLVVLPMAAESSDSVRVKDQSFTAAAEVMTRGEWRSGALPGDGDDDDAKFVLERTRLNLNYRRPHLEVGLMAQHSGVWGQKGKGTLNMQEAWVRLDYRGLFAKVGRQTLYYDDERIIGRNDWTVAGSSHDALKLGFENAVHKAHVVLSFNQNSENTNGGTYYVDGAQPYKSLVTAWYHIDPIRQLGASLLFMNTGLQNILPEKNTTEYQQVWGAYVDYHPRDVRLQGSYYRQSGKNEAHLPIKAWMMSVDATWRIAKPWTVNGGYYVLSGDKDYYTAPPGGIGLALLTNIGGFTPVYGSHHQFYGAMDFFYLSTYYGGNSPGLQDLYVGGQWRPIDRLAVGAKYHYLATSVDIEDEPKSLGHEIELSAKFQVMKFVSLQAGYTYMRGTDTMKVLKRTGDKNRLQWGWIMLTVNPTIFTSKF